MVEIGAGRIGPLDARIYVRNCAYTESGQSNAADTSPPKQRRSRLISYSALCVTPFYKIPYLVCTRITGYCILSFQSLGADPAFWQRFDRSGSFIRIY